MSERQEFSAFSVVAVFVIGLFVGALCVLVVSAAHAAPPPNSSGTMAAWYATLARPDTGTSCCSEADCRVTVTKFRDPARWSFDAGWVAKVDGVWTDIPPHSVILGHDHPAGSAVVCAVGGRVLCFTPPSAAR